MTRQRRGWCQAVALAAGLVLWAGCDDEATAPTAPPRAAAGPDGGAQQAGAERVAAPPRYLEPELTPSRCPQGQHRCCDGSCSPTKGCPGIACDPGPEQQRRDELPTADE